MKHLTAMSIEKPAKAEEMAWIQLKDIVSPNLPKNPNQFIGQTTGNMTQAQATWMAAQFDNWLSK